MLLKNNLGLTQIFLPKNASLKFNLELNTSLLNRGRKVNFLPQKLNVFIFTFTENNLSPEGSFLKSHSIPSGGLKSLSKGLALIGLRSSSEKFTLRITVKSPSGLQSALDLLFFTINAHLGRCILYSFF